MSMVTLLTTLERKANGVVFLLFLVGVVLLGGNSKENPQKNIIETQKLPVMEDVSVLYSYDIITNDTSVYLTQEEAYMLMRVAKHEAGTKNYEDSRCTSDNPAVKAQALIMRVILNRVENESFPNTVMEVLMQRNPVQFSVCVDGTIYDTEPDVNSHYALALVESGWDKSKGSLYFDAAWGGETWQYKNKDYLFEFEGTRFYK